jgi:hypothetical protein
LKSAEREQKLNTVTQSSGGADEWNEEARRERGDGGGKRPSEGNGGGKRERELPVPIKSCSRVSISALLPASYKPVSPFIRCTQPPDQNLSEYLSGTV